MFFFFLEIVTEITYLCLVFPRHSDVSHRPREDRVKVNERIPDYAHSAPSENGIGTVMFLYFYLFVRARTLEKSEEYSDGTDIFYRSIILGEHSRVNNITALEPLRI